MSTEKNKVVAIVGPTGSGKTGVSITIAKKINAEIISADSRAIYKGMDIGTAKASMEEMNGVMHYGLDLVSPGERFTVADWKKYAEKKIDDIEGRGKRAMVVGGTGLYVDALVYDYHFLNDVKNTCSDRNEMCSKYLMVGVKWESKELKARITERVNKIFVQKLFDETQVLVEKYGWDNQAMTGNIYKFAWDYMQGNLDKEEAKRRATYADWHLAKRQMTWFKRNDKIIWLPLEKVEAYVLKCIQDE